MITQAMRKKMTELFGPNVNCKADADLEKLILQAIKEKKISPSELTTLTKQPGGKANKKEKTVTQKKKPGPTKAAPTKKPNPKAASVFVKTPSARYSSKKAPALNRFGQPGMSQGKALELPSQRELALTGVFIKNMAAKSGLYGGILLNDHEKQLLAELAQAEQWIEFSPSAGRDGSNCWWDKASAPRVKAILDDTVSGGQYANPIFYDQNVILPALLQGELYPQIQVVEQPRGRTINSAKIGIPTATWGVTDNTALTAFTTTSLISQIVGTVFNIAVYLEIGNDVMADSTPLDLGTLVQQQIGQRFQAELDKVIAVGDGTTQPTGIFTSPGGAAVSSDNSTAGPPTVSDVESLIFSIGKQYRQAPYSPFLVMNDTMYRRTAGISVGPTDERRVFGMNGSNLGGTAERPGYTLFNHPCRIQNDIPNGSAAFLPGQAFRMWRRLGMETHVSREGNYFMTRNLTGIVVRGRFAGKIVLPEALATMTDGQS